MNTIELIDSAKKASGIESDYRLAQVIDVTKGAVSSWRQGKSHPDDELAARLAEMAGENPASVVAELHAARAKTPGARALWMQMAQQLRHAVAAVLVAMGAVMLALAPSPQGAQAGQLDSASTLCVMSNRVRRFRRAVMAWRVLCAAFGGIAGAAGFLAFLARKITRRESAPCTALRASCRRLNCWWPTSVALPPPPAISA